MSPMRSFYQQKLICYVLIFSLISGFFAPTLVSALASETRVLICTSQGYQWVTVYEEQSLESIGSDKSAHCVYCLTSIDDVELTPVIGPYFDPKQVNYQLPLYSFYREHAYLGLLAQPRAPPAFI